MEILFPVIGIFLLYAKLEEEHGLARHAMTVYDRATKAVPADEQVEVRMYVSLVTCVKKLIWCSNNPS